MTPTRRQALLAAAATLIAAVLPAKAPAGQRNHSAGARLC